MVKAKIIEGIEGKINIKNIFLFLVLFSILFTSFVFASHIIRTSSGSTSYNVAEDAGFIYNISINNSDLGQDANITQVNITFSSSVFLYVPGVGNGTTLINYSFENTSTTLSYSNFTYYLINGSDGSVLNYIWFNATASTPGNYNISVMTLNSTGAFYSNISVSVNDTTAPSSISFANPVETDGTNISRNNIQVNVSGTDNGVIDKIIIRLYNSSQDLINTSISSAGVASYYINFTGLSDGVYRFNSTINDTYGNSNSSSGTRSVRIDTSGPSANFDEPPTPAVDSILYQNNFQVSFGVSDNVGIGTAIIRLYNSSNVLINTTINITITSGQSLVVNYLNLSYGNYKFNATVNDSAGNTQDSATMRVNLHEPSGANYTFVNPSSGLVERASSNLFNISVGAISMNITQVQINFTGGIYVDPNSFILGSNGSSASNVFTNVSISNASMGPFSSQVLSLTFRNSSSSPLIQSGGNENFWFNITTRTEISSVLQSNVLVSGVRTNGTGISNFTAPNFGYSFRFSGYVRNETGGLQNNTNVTLYRFENVPMSPPIEIAVQSVLTDSNGAFTMTGLNGSGGIMYTIKTVYYNSSGSATKIGNSLPPFPAQMFYPPAILGDIPQFDFMRPPSLNGSTFYLGPAATINITATNGSTFQKFGYLINDQKTGLEIASNIFGKVDSAQVVVPTNKRYTVMIIRANQQFEKYEGGICNGSFMNDTACPTPPKSNSTLYPTITGSQTDVSIDLVMNSVQMYGCIQVSGNTSAISNITSILPRMLPWEGFVPPMRPDTGNLDLTSTDQLNYSDSRCTGKIAWYNISLLNSNYLVEFYGSKNGTTVNGSENLGAFQTANYNGQPASANIMQNITLKPLAGNYYISGETNTTKIKVNIQNSSGGAITSDTPHVNLFLRDSSTFGELTYIIDDMDEGTFYIISPLSATAKLKIFSNNAPPKEKTLNLSMSEINITLINMQGGDGGFRKISANGSLEVMNITSSNFDVEMNFLRTGGNCDGLYPDNNTCTLSSSAAKSFNPMEMMMSGNVNMEMKMPSNVSIIFYNFDMGSAKQPPMESVMNDGASGGSSSDPVWEFGSFVPADVYDYAIIAMPYSDSNIDDSTEIKMSISNLYDENWNVVWNSSRGDTSENFTNSMDEYLGNSNNRSYNSTGYRNFTLTGGLSCSKNDINMTGSNPSSYCFVNTTENIMYMRVPHFSGVAPLVRASAPAGGGGDGDSGGGSGGGGGGGGISLSPGTNWITTFTQNDKELEEKGEVMRSFKEKQRVSLKISGETHHVGVLEINKDSVKIQISSTIQESTLSNGEERKFEVNGDNFYDLKVKVVDIKTNLTNISINYLREEIPVEQINPAPGINNPIEEIVSTDTGDQNLGNNKGKENKLYSIILMTLIVVVLVIAIMMSIIYYTKKKRHKHPQMHSFYP